MVVASAACIAYFPRRHHIYCDAGGTREGRVPAVRCSTAACADTFGNRVTALTTVERPDPHPLITRPRRWLAQAVEMGPGAAVVRKAA